MRGLSGSGPERRTRGCRSRKGGSLAGRARAGKPAPGAPKPVSPEPGRSRAGFPLPCVLVKGGGTGPHSPRPVGVEAGRESPSRAGLGGESLPWKRPGSAGLSQSWSLALSLLPPCEKTSGGSVQPSPSRVYENRADGGSDRERVARDGRPSRAVERRRLGLLPPLDLPWLSSPLPERGEEPGTGGPPEPAGIQERGPVPGRALRRVPARRWGSEPELVSGFFPPPSFEKSSRGFVQLFPARICESRADGAQSGQSGQRGQARRLGLGLVVSPALGARAELRSSARPIHPPPHTDRLANVARLL